jgi:hypothetical protein
MFREAAVTNQNEGILLYTCPETSRGVVTGISTNDCTLKRLASVKFSVWCPHCASPHVIAGKEASVIVMRAEELPVPDLLDASGPPEQELLSHSS